MQPLFVGVNSPGASLSGLSLDPSSGQVIQQGWPYVSHLVFYHHVIC